MVSLAILALLAAAAPERALPFDRPGWELRGDAVVEPFDGRDTVRIDTGWAVRRDVVLEDGTLEFDVRVTRRRSFVYVTFRMADDRELEEMYLRPHKSDLPDAVQYAPVYQGQSAWQLYHGPGATAAVPFEAGAWTRVRVVLQGRRAALFVGTMNTPVLVVPRLGREPRAGYIALRSFVPPGTRGSVVGGRPEPAARFANVVVRPDAAVDLSTLPVPPVAAEAQAVRAWAVSEALPAPAGDVPPVVASWRDAETLPSGLLELHRVVTLPEGKREMTAAARVVVRASSAGTRRLDLGFSDGATVFLNGQPLFRGEAAYDYEGRREGLIRYDQARLYLPLRAGDNEVMVVVTDGFGGMGLMGRFPDAAGLTVEAR
jgi:hypothetical protein